MTSVDIASLVGPQSYIDRLVQTHAKRADEYNVIGDEETAMVERAAGASLIMNRLFHQVEPYIHNRQNNLMLGKLLSFVNEKKHQFLENKAIKEDMPVFTDRNDRFLSEEPQNLIGLESEQRQLANLLTIPLLAPYLSGGTLENVLLFGPPGSGKTEMVFAQLHRVFHASRDDEDGIRLLYFEPKIGDLKSKFVGETEKRVDRLFETLAKAAEQDGVQVVVFLDEIETITPNRQDSSGSAKNMVNALLAAMDRVKALRVTILAATNFPDKMDPAILRRFTHKLFVGFPQETSRKALLYRKILRHFRNCLPSPLYKNETELILPPLSHLKKVVGIMCEGAPKQSSMNDVGRMFHACLRCMAEDLDSPSFRGLVRYDGTRVDRRKMASPSVRDVIVDSNSGRKINTIQDSDALGVFVHPFEGMGKEVQSRVKFFPLRESYYVLKRKPQMRKYVDSYVFAICAGNSTKFDAYTRVALAENVMTLIDCAKPKIVFGIKASKELNFRPMRKVGDGWAFANAEGKEIFTLEQHATPPALLEHVRRTCTSLNLSTRVAKEVKAEIGPSVSEAEYNHMIAFANSLQN